MDSKYSFIEDDFELDDFQQEFGKTVEANYYEKNKLKFGLVYFLIMLASVAIAFFLYGLLQNLISSLTGI